MDNFRTGKPSTPCKLTSMSFSLKLSEKCAQMNYSEKLILGTKKSISKAVSLDVRILVHVALLRYGNVCLWIEWRETSIIRDFCTS